MTDTEKAILLESQCPEVEPGTHGESLSTRKSWGRGSLNTPALIVRVIRSVSLRRGIVKGVCKKQDKGMNEVPTSVYNVRDIRNAGTPTGCESYGVGVLVVVDGVTPIQGDGNTDHRAKQDRLVSNKYRRVRNA